MTLGSRKCRMTRHVFGFLLLGCLGANLAAAQAKTRGTSGRQFVLPHRSHGLQGLASTTDFQSLGPVDDRAAKWWTADAGNFCRTSVSSSSIRSTRESIFRPIRRKWFNYGGDKLWPLPEGNDDEQHWAGGSDSSTMGRTRFERFRKDNSCEVRTYGPADPRTGIQFLRTIRLDSDSPRIRFRATMKNTTGHPLEWSMQSVSQYDTCDDGDTPSQINSDFRALRPRTRQQLSQSLPRRFGPGGKSFRVDPRRRTVFTALRSYGGGIMARLDCWLAGGRRWQQPLWHGRAVSI